MLRHRRLKGGIEVLLQLADPFGADPTLWWRSDTESDMIGQVFTYFRREPRDGRGLSHVE